MKFKLYIYFSRDKNLSTNYIRNPFANETAVASRLLVRFETQESLYGIFIPPLKFTQPFEIYVRFSPQPLRNPFSFSPLFRNQQSSPHPPCATWTRLRSRNPLGKVPSRGPTAGRVQTTLCDREPSSRHVLAGRKKSSFQILIETIPLRWSMKFRGSWSLANIVCYLYNACPAPSMDTWRFPAAGITRKVHLSCSFARKF